MDASNEASVDSGCNALTNVATAIEQTFVASDPVAGDGGVLVSGTYVCTAAVVYTGADGGTGPTGLTLQDTVEIDDGGIYERVGAFTNDAGLDGSAFHQNGTIVTNGAKLTVKQTCPSGSQPFDSFDSNGTVLHIYAPPIAGNPGVMFEYTKQ